MSGTGFDPGAVIDASAVMLGLSLADADLAVVKLHLETAERLARQVLDFPLEDEAEPAPVFAP